ncbi:MAG TPA: hypothetical protein VGE16_14995 [Albitalea sp.]
METPSAHPDCTATRQPDVEALLHLHTARRRLMIALQRRQRLGEPVEGLEAELATLQREVQHVLADFAATNEDGAR